MALAIGAGGGFLFNMTGIPLAWMLGSMVFTLVASLVRVPLAGPRKLRTPMIAIIGATLGASFTPDVIAGMQGWALTITGLLVAGTVATLLGFLFMSRVAGLDRATSFFASTPGGLLEMSMMGEERGGDGRLIILSHTIRIFCVVLILPPALAWAYGFTRFTADAASPETTLFSPAPFAWFLLCCFVGIYAGKKLRLPAAMLTGPMLASGIVHLSGLSSFKLPPELVAIAQVVIGAGLGTRFLGVRFSEVTTLLWASVGSMGIHLICAIAAGLVIARISGYPFLQILLAYSPGGIAEMSLVAIATGADAAFVATHHIVRVVAGLAASPFLFARLTGDTQD